jgi:hypothetical protein
MALMFMNDQTTFQRSPKVAFHRLGAGSDDGVLLHLESAAYFSLNSLGVMIWQILEEPMGLPDIVRRVSEAVDDAPSCLGEDVERFLEELQSRGLLEHDQGQAAGAGLQSDLGGE